MGLLPIGGSACESEVVVGWVGTSRSGWVASMRAKYAPPHGIRLRYHSEASYCSTSPPPLPLARPVQPPSERASKQPSTKHSMVNTYH